MARVFPFQPYRYSERAGRLEDLVTQPYDKITPEMQARYSSLSPHNLVRIILGERFPTDAAENVYTRAARRLRDWIEAGILVQEREPSVFPYFQEFCVPDTGERLVRKGFIALGAVEDYSAGIVHRHEQTLSGPKQDRLELLRHTRAHFGQIFMLYPDPKREIDGMLDEAARAEPVAVVHDEYQAVHRLWKISDPALLAVVQAKMSGKKLLIADGHHRYETALAFAREHPELEDAQKVMMTFVNMDSPGVKILATHRLVSGIETAGLIEAARASFRLLEIAGLGELRRAWAEPHSGKVRAGVALEGSPSLWLIEADRGASELDVTFLHQRILRDLLGIDEEAVRAEKNLRYVRGADRAIDEVRSGRARAAFLLEPVSIQDVARVAFSGGVMPQKSTDFYPKLLSGLTIYKLDR